jgi:NAD(P)-dependent dehydrogenase (short-subunit alcohol dehydrogenase family)
MSKGALNVAGKSLSIDLKPRGIAVVLLHPGFVRTNMTGGVGDIDAVTAADQLIERIDALDLEHSGRFLHARGDELPW